MRKAILTLATLVTLFLVAALSWQNVQFAHETDQRPRKIFCGADLQEQVKHSSAIFEIEILKNDLYPHPYGQGNCLYEVKVEKAVLNNYGELPETIQIGEESVRPGRTDATCKPANKKYLLLLVSDFKEGMLKSPLMCGTSFIADISKKDEILKLLNERVEK